MTEYKTILVEDHGHTAWITLNRPDALNAISLEMIADLDAALTPLQDRRHLSSLVVTGAGRAFCAGADLKATRQRTQGTDGSQAHGEFLDNLRQLLLRIERFPAPVIAAVNGLALAGGLELVLATDLVIAAESAKFGDAHANYGLVPGGGSSVRLPRKVGVTRAKMLIYTGDFRPAAEMTVWGLVNETVPDGSLKETVEALAAKLSQKSPIGLARMKRMVDDGLQQNTETALRYELALNAEHGRSHDRAEGLKAFTEKRPPQFKGR